MKPSKKEWVVSLFKPIASIVIAVPLGVSAGLAMIFFLETILPHGKSWQIPMMFLGAFVFGSYCGILCQRSLMHLLGRIQASTNNSNKPEIVVN